MNSHLKKHFFLSGLSLYEILICKIRKAKLGLAGLACLGTFLMLIGLTLQFPSAAIAAENVKRLPFQLEGRDSFVDGAKPLFFCECSEVPVDLPNEAADQRNFQLIRGVIGVSQDQTNKHYVLRKWSLFQVIKTDGSKEKRLNERVIEFPDKPIQDDESALELASDMPTKGSTATRRTELKLNKKDGTGFIRIILWSTGDRGSKPQFDHTYPFRYVNVE